MHNRIFRQNSGLSKSSSTPAPNPFESRPFAPAHEELPQPQETQDLEQLKQDALQTKGSGYNFANVNVTPRETKPLPMLQSKLTMGETGNQHEQKMDDVKVDYNSEKPSHLQTAQASHSSAAIQPISQNKNAPSNELVVQRVASQIIPNFTAEKGGTQKATSIRQVQIIGRPEKVFSSTMGDHTTAFAVHREAIKQQLEGQDFVTAFEVIQGFYDTALNLPGWELRNGLPEKHKQRLAQAQATLETLLKTKSNPPSAQTISALQQTVGAYLEFRELMPLSTINVRAKSPVHAGKGKGEASKVSTLVAHQRGELQSAEVRQQAIVGLFDASSVALAIVEQNDTMLSKMLPGLGGDAALKERMGKIIKQHLLSIKQGFPGVFDQDLTVEKVEAALDSALKLEMEDWLIATAEDLEKTRNIRNRWISEKTKEMVVETKRRQEKIGQMIQGWTEEVKVLGEKLGVIKQAYQDFFGKELVIPKPDQEMGEADKEDLDETEELPTSKKQKLPQSDMEEDTEAAVEAAETPELVEEEDEEAEERKSPLAMQIVLNPAGQIAEILSAGRTPSPFPGTMGAHTTAWIVHVDRVRKALTGLKPADAIETVEKVLVPEANTLEAEREKKFNIHQEHTDLLAATKANLTSFPAKLKQYDSAGQLLGLQQYVDELLTYINYIPGSTLEATDTGGKSEGSHRNVLMAFEQGGSESKQALRTAIFGLLDLNYNLTNQSQQSQLKQQHREMIKATYPNAYEAVFENKHGARLISYPAAPNNRKRKI